MIPLIGELVIVSVVSISVTVQLLSGDDFNNMQNVGGIYMSAGGTLFSVALGMILVNAPDEFSDAKKHINKESEGLLKVHAYVLQIPQRYRTDVATSIKK